MSEAKELSTKGRIVVSLLAAALLVLGLYEFGFVAATQALCESGCLSKTQANVLLAAAAAVALLAWGSAATLIAAAVRGRHRRHLRVARILFLANLAGVVAWYGLALLLYELTGSQW